MADDVFGEGTYAERQAKKQCQQEQHKAAEQTIADSCRFSQAEHERLAEWAEAAGVKRSHLMAWLVLRGLDELDAGRWKIPTGPNLGR